MSRAVPSALHIIFRNTLLAGKHGLVTELSSVFQEGTMFQSERNRLEIDLLFSFWPEAFLHTLTMRPAPRSTASISDSGEIFVCPYSGRWFFCVMIQRGPF